MVEEGRLVVPRGDDGDARGAAADRDLALPAEQVALDPREALAAAGVVRPWREVLHARGASYMLGLVSYLAGQGGMGFWLAESGVPAGRAAGAVLLLMIANGIVLVLLGAAGLAVEMSRLEGVRTDLLLLTIAAAVAGILVYLIVIAVRPRWLERYALLAPLFEAGLGVHAIYLRNVVVTLEGGYLFPFEKVDELAGFRATLAVNFTMW